jgi:hypothetical protein
MRKGFCLLGISMGTIDDVRRWLKKIPLWRELGKIPERMTALEKRMAGSKPIEARARRKMRNGCGELGLRLQSSRIVEEATNKYIKLKWKCEKCGLTIEKLNSVDLCDFLLDHLPHIRLFFCNGNEFSVWEAAAGRIGS